MITEKEIRELHHSDNDVAKIIDNIFPDDEFWTGMWGSEKSIEMCNDPRLQAALALKLLTR